MMKNACEGILWQPGISRVEPAILSPRALIVVLSVGAKVTFFGATFGVRNQI